MTEKPQKTVDYNQFEMASLRNLDPDLRRYLRRHHLPEIYEALLSGLAIMCPKDPHQWIIEKLTLIQDMDIHDLDWDTFIDEAMKPRHPFIGERNMDFVFSLDDGNQPTPEMFAKAYAHYNDSIKKKTFNAWMQYHLWKGHALLERNRKMTMAVTHYNHRRLRLVLNIWREWTSFRMGRQAMAFEMIQRTYFKSLARIIFQAWHGVSLDSRKTREYFERLERGENVEDEDVLNLGTGEARDDVSRMPKDVRVQIFRHLNIVDLARCSRVCRSWKVMTQSSSLWNRIDFSSVKDIVDDKIASRLLGKCRPFLIHLNMSGCQRLSRDTFLSVSECRNLQDINMSECSNLNDDLLTTISSGCRVLLYLNVSYTEITDNSLRNLAKYALNLQYFSVAYCPNFSDKGLDYFGKGKGGKKLVYLDMSGCTQITEKGFAALCEGCSGIQHWILNDMPMLTDEYIKIITSHCKRIETVELLGAGRLTDDSMRFLSSRHLKKVKIDSNHQLTDTSMRYFGKNCPELYFLQLMDCPKLTDQALKFTTGLRHLRVVNLADCIRITDTGVRYLAESPSCHVLRELNLTNCIRVGDMALVNLTKRCHQLTHLSTCFCNNITEAGIEILGTASSLVFIDLSGCSCGDGSLSSLGNNHHLREIVLSDCANVTDLGLQKFAQQCRDMERIDASFCHQLTDGAIKNLAFCCRLLTSLNLCGCRQLTDLSMQYISGVCHHLKYLNMSGCIMITEKSLKYLKKGCRRLRHLVILYCKAISKSSAVKLTRGIPKVDYSCDDPPAYFGYNTDIS